jgi:beta-glucanase (GH16 family)
VPITTATSGYTSGDTACFVNSANNISVGNGYLSLTARLEPAPFTCVDPLGSFQTQETSGDLSTYGLFSQAYGRFQIDAQVPASAIPGLQSSFWLFPQNETKYGAWPASGEIDIAEVYSEYPNLAIPYLHYNVDGFDVNPAQNINTVTNDSCTITPGQFHDYVVEWTPTSITMIYDGTTCLIDHWSPAWPQAAPQPFDQPFFVNLTQALGLAPNSYNSSTPLPASTEVRDVRVWQEQP